MLTLSATLRSARLACLARMGLHARAWLAVWFIVFASLSPTVTQALAATQGPGHGLEVCTSSGTRTLAPDGSLDLAADAGAPQGDGHPQAWRAAIARCACCRTAVWHRRQPPLFLQRHSYGRLHRHGLHLRHQ